MAIYESNTHKEIIYDALRGYKSQERLDKRPLFNEIEEFLIDSINFYQEVYFLEEDCSDSKAIFQKFGLNKKQILSNININYSTQLNLLKNLGKDVSEYPKDLEDLIK